MKNSTFLFLLLCIAGHLSAQNNGSILIERTLEWRNAPEAMYAPDGLPIEVWNFEGCSRSDLAPSLPLFNERFVLSGPANFELSIEDEQWEAFDKKSHEHDGVLGTSLQTSVRLEQERQQFYGRLTFHPIRKTSSGGFERLRSFRINVRTTPHADMPAIVSNGVAERGTTTSVLADGDIYKFGVTQSAVYKLDYDFVRNKLGMSNLDQIDPRNLRLYGNGGAMLPERNSTPRPDDLLENAMVIIGEEDGKFNAGDYILFYAAGPSTINTRQVNNTPQLSIQNNLYDKNAWYFLKISSTPGLRIQDKASINEGTLTETFDAVERIEEEKENLLDYSDAHQGSGKRWFGDRFEQTRTRSYTMNFPNLIENSTTVRMEFAGRCESSTTVSFKAGSATFSSNIGSISRSNYNGPVAQAVALGGVFAQLGDVVSMEVNYLPSTRQSEGWLDYIEVNARRKLLMHDKVMSFRDLATRNYERTRYKLGNVSGGNLQIWDLSKRAVPAKQGYILNGSAAEFGVANDSLVVPYIAFYDNADFPKPEATVGKIANQNLHGLDEVQMIIVYHETFENAVQELAQHRREFSGMTVATVKIGDIFNEFSSGGKDPVAIRDFARLLYERNPANAKYLLLFGDGSFDPKNNSNGEGNNDFVPVWETETSLDPIQSHPSDDFFGLLSPNEDGSIQGALEISIGRITARDATEAEVIVRKIINYETSPETLGDWHLRQLYAADDQESNHLDQAEKLSKESVQEKEWFNIQKVYFDAYQRVATSSEKRIPDAKAAINADIFKGVLVTNYIGHGGPKGWAQERVVDNADIAGWDNLHKQPLFITATCSFGGYDDYSFLTGGEQILSKSDGGGIALFTTVRAVYIGANDALTNAVQKFIFKRETYGYRPIGDILREGKNSLSGGTEDNARRFTLLGDPAMRLAMPEHSIQTDSVNGRAIASGQPDTLRALSRVSIAGSVRNLEGALLNNFNGRVFVTVFDKPQTLTTLALNGSPKREFSVQRNILFKGSATVTNGKFRVNFVLPKDINYSFGNGKISYYAENGTPLDGAGADNSSVVIGGTSSAVKDDTPPLVRVFLNTNSFVTGGITDDDPKIVVECTDDNGMNVSGTSIGHDLTAVLDDNTLETIVLNEFYESKQDNPLEGRAVYPLRNLAAGRHTLRVKGWDIANNSGEDVTEFVVSEDGKAALDHVLNYPNPFTTNTAFQFEHNLAGQVMDVHISIFTVSGKLVKTIQHTAAPEGFRVTDISWDGKDDYGDQLARGVYVYRVKVRGTNITGAQVTAESKFEKLVLLK